MKATPAKPSWGGFPEEGRRVTFKNLKEGGYATMGKGRARLPCEGRMNKGESHACLSIEGKKPGAQRSRFRETRSAQSNLAGPKKVRPKKPLLLLARGQQGKSHAAPGGGRGSPQHRRRDIELKKRPNTRKAKKAQLQAETI